ncbi:adhesion G protein-coupled receptor L2-like isoform X2 [Hydractinia symbiolongicarpus]|uniref:adhesion G protein-coupled receptor L2-like isoform X2 n=1 Tax=Hydractinia symbiolongicarpus TaxID=13093 RepID=UPI00255165FD|nr:adhesion G protein-coupled receptor L2-like isoform X2 [Hydractinia symbiolongicarpus]
MDISIHLYVLLCCYFLKADGIKPPQECGKPTGIAILIDYTEGVPDAVLTEIYRIEVRMQQRFKDNSLVKNSHQYNGVSCGNTTNLQLDDPVSNPRKTYRMDSANVCLKEYLKSLTNDGSRRRRNFYSMNIALSTSVEEWIPDHIKQKNIDASKYLVFFVNASDGEQRIFDINLPTKDNLLINDINDLLDKIILFVCQYTPTATPVTATKRQGSSTFYLPTTSTSRSRPSQPTRSSRPSRPYSSSSTSRPTRPSRPSTDSRTSRPSRRSRAPHTSPTNTKRKKLKKEIRNFTSQNITTEQLSNTTWATNFLQSSSELLNQTQQKDTDVEEDEAEEMMKFIEETLVKVGTSLPVGASVSIVTESLVADVTAVETKTFQGYLFPNQSTTENKASLLNLPHNLLKNSTSDKTGIVGMKFKPLVSMKKVANHLAVGDDVISISVDPPVRTPFEEPINYTMIRIQNNFNHQQCVYWNTSLEKWDSFGCNVSEISEEYITCQCTHMTSFSILMQVKDFEIADKHVFALAVLTYVGCGVSVASCICLILIYVCLRRMLRIDRNVIHVNLSFAIAIANALFLSADSATKKKDICLGISIGMLYFYLATFFWMFVEGVHVYLMMFKVFKSKKRMPIYLLIGWVFPAFITAGVSLKYHSLMTTEEFCWLSTEKGVIWAFVGPALFVIVVNTVILCMTLVASRRISVGDDGEPELKRIARLTLVLMPIFGISWVIGVFAINEQTILFQYIFTAVNVFQGLFIFIGYGMMNNEVRREASRRKQMFHSADISRSISTGKTNYASTMKSHRFSSVDNPTYNGGYLTSTSDAVDTPSPSNSYRSSIVGDAPQDKEPDYAINESYRSSTFLTQQRYLTKI